jgi:hypothetical protein
MVAMCTTVPEMVAMGVAAVVGGCYEGRSDVLPCEIRGVASQHRRDAH